VAGNKAFGDRVRQLREAKLRIDPRFTLRQFARMVDVSPTFLSKMERGEFDPPKPEKIKKMAELLEVDADELLALAGRVDPELNEIIREQPSVLPDLLRTVRGMSDEQLRKLARQAERARKKES